MSFEPLHSSLSYHSLIIFAFRHSVEPDVGNATVLVNVLSKTEMHVEILFTVRNVFYTQDPYC